MPRKARIDAPGALQHIIIRGIERKAIFNDSQDYQNFIERLGTIFLAPPALRRKYLSSLAERKAK